MSQTDACRCKEQEVGDGGGLLYPERKHLRLTKQNVTDSKERHEGGGCLHPP